MSKGNELAINTLILTIGKVSTQALSFFCIPLYISVLNPEEFGIFDLFNTYILFLAPLFGLQLDNGLFRFLIQNRDNFREQQKLFSSVLVATIVQIIIFSIAFLVFRGYLDTTYRNFLLYDVIATIILNLCLQLCRGIGDNINYSIASFINTVASLTIVLVLLFGYNLRVESLFWGAVISKVIAIIFLSYKKKVLSYFSLSLISLSVLRRILTYSLPLVPNQVSWWVISAVDRSIIAYSLGLLAVGVYSLAMKISGVFITAYNVFHLAWIESVSLYIKEVDSESFISSTINTIIVIATSAITCFLAILPLLFSHFIDAKYVEAYNQIPILLISVFMQMMVGLYSAIYVALEKTTEIMKTSLYAAGINVILNILFINYIGLYASSFAITLSYLAMALYRHFHVKKYLKISLNFSTLFWQVMYLIIITIAYYNYDVNGFDYSQIVICIFAFCNFIIGNRNFILKLIRKI